MHSTVARFSRTRFARADRGIDHVFRARASPRLLPPTTRLGRTQPASTNTWIAFRARSGVSRSPEERAWSQAIYNLLRNRHRGELGSVRVQMLDRLLKVQAQLLVWAQAGESVGRTVEQLQNDLRSLEISSQGSAMYETTAAAEHRSRKEGITREQAFAKELTPDRYERAEAEHQELELGITKKKRGKK
jgi:hypothetical protein